MKVWPDVFVTTKVNYGDRSSGCIAVAAVQETVEQGQRGGSLVPEEKEICE